MQMEILEKKEILDGVKIALEALTYHSQNAQAESFLEYYADSPDFLAFSADGIMRNYEAYKDICRGYYDSIKRQDISTIQEVFHVISAEIVLLGWTGNITAFLKTGEI